MSHIQNLKLRDFGRLILKHGTPQVAYTMFVLSTLYICSSDSYSTKMYS